MDNKEAIYRIQDYMRVHRLYEPNAVWINEALNLAIKALHEREPEPPVWISVKDNPPDYLEPVFVYSLANGIITAIYPTSGQWVCDDGYYVDDVTHWMPLPQPPSD